MRELEKSAEKREYVIDFDELKRDGIKYYTRFDEGFPEKLKNIPDAPKQLFVLGELPDPDKKAIGIVGARRCTAYGRDMARMFGFRLAQAGVNVISGMALGVDGWSHQGALEAGGRTYAVLGSGVKVCYPQSHRKLYNSIQERGGIISENHPTMPALPDLFPQRNRIISGLSDGLLVVEARQRSGSLITADMALAQGKDVYVIPGRIGDELSIGCNRLIQQGAIPVLSPDDILERLGLTTTPTSLVVEELTPEEQKILKLIGPAPISLAELTAKNFGDRVNTHKTVLRLLRKKLIRETSRDRYIIM